MDFSDIVVRDADTTGENFEAGTDGAKKNHVNEMLGRLLESYHALARTEATHSDVAKHIANKTKDLISRMDLDLEKLLEIIPEDKTALLASIKEIISGIESPAETAEIIELTELYEQHVSIERVGRQAELGAMMESFRGASDAEALKNFSPEHLAVIRNAIERKNWNSLFRVSTGDRLIVFTEPKLQATKKFNDILFGPLKTDILIGKRNILLREKLADSKFDGAVYLLEQSFKNSFFKVDRDAKLSETELLDLLNKACKEVDREMTIIVDTAIEEELKALSFSPTKDLKRQSALEAFQKENHQKGYVVSFGISVVSEDGDNKYVGIAQSACEAWTASLLYRSKETDNYGGKLEQDEMMEKIRAHAETRKKIFDALRATDRPTIANNSGKSYVVFDGTVLHEDLLREIRKGTFSPSQEDAELFALIDTYRQEIGLIDVVKPYTSEEISGSSVLQTTNETLTARVDREHAISQRIAQYRALQKKSAATGLDSAEVAQFELLGEGIIEEKNATVEIIETSKDGLYSSDATFHYEAINTPECAYITLDALDVGIRGLQLADRLMQEVERDEKTITEVLLTAGDEVTRDMRVFRMKVLEIAKQFYKEKIPTLIGGDELTLAVDISKISVEELDKMLLTIRTSKEFKVRLVMAKANKRNGYTADGDVRKNTVIKLIEHVNTLRRVERGVDEAKKIEKSLRELQLYANNTKTWDKNTRAKYDELRQILHIEGFVVQETDTGQFILKTNGFGNGQTTTEILQTIVALLET